MDAGAADRPWIGFGGRDFAMPRGSEPRIRRALRPRSSSPARRCVCDVVVVVVVRDLANGEQTSRMRVAEHAIPTDASDRRGSGGARSQGGRSGVVAVAASVETCSCASGGSETRTISGSHHVVATGRGQRVVCDQSPQKFVIRRASAVSDKRIPHHEYRVARALPSSSSSSSWGRGGWSLRRVT